MDVPSMRPTAILAVHIRFRAKMALRRTGKMPVPRHIACAAAQAVW